MVSLNHYEVRTFEGYFRRRFKDLALSTKWIIARVAWRFCRAGRRSGVAAKFAHEASENERRSREKNKLLPPQSPRGFSALARLYYLARPTKTAMLRRLVCDKFELLGHVLAAMMI